jgi:hypothetical protein
MFPHKTRCLVSIVVGLIAAAAVMFSSLAHALDQIQLF